MSDNNQGSQGGTPDGAQNPPQYGQNQPQYGQNQPQYGQNQPQYGQTPGSYGQNQPQYGQDSGSYGQQGTSPYGQSQSPYGQGGNYPGQQGYQGQPAENPGRTLGIVGLILAILLAPVGLIISIVALVKSRKARMGNGFAVAGIIIGTLFTIGIVLIFALIAAAAPLIQEVGEACQGVGSGETVTVQGQTVTCP